MIAEQFFHDALKGILLGYALIFTGLVLFLNYCKKKINEEKKR